MEGTDILADYLGAWSQNPMQLETIALRIAMAFALSALLGCERSSKRHSAGLRTFIIVGIASVFAALFDWFMIEKLHASVTFLSAATVIGVAVISCNTILFSSKSQLKGLTTSVALWGTGLVSLGIGFGLYAASILGFMALYLCLSVFARLENHYKSLSELFEVHLELKNRNLLPEFTSAVRQAGLKIDDIEMNAAYANSGLGVYTVKLQIVHKPLKGRHHSEIISALSDLDCVHFIEEI